jgi:hypothetical protein
MSDGVRETPCTHCVHRTVCKHKDNFLKAIQAVNEATVHEREDDRMKMTKVVNIDCVSDISVTCRYHQPEVATPREGIF